MTEDQPEPETFADAEISAAIESLRADMSRLLAVVTFDRMLASPNVRGMRGIRRALWDIRATARKADAAESPVTRRVTQSDFRDWSKEVISA